MRYFYLENYLRVTNGIGKEKIALKALSKTLGKETIGLFNTSETRSNANSYGLNYKRQERS